MHANGFGHMTRMVTMTIYGKHTLKIFCSRTRRSMNLVFGMRYAECSACQVCSNDDHMLP